MRVQCDCTVEMTKLTVAFLIIGYAVLSIDYCSVLIYDASMAPMTHLFSYDTLSCFHDTTIQSLNYYDSITLLLSYNSLITLL